ncbi:hypothetical protein BH10ACT1_BH10ACT1_20250 [soil metagenome]
MRIRHHRRNVDGRADRRERGTVLVEMAIVSVFLLTIAAGAFDLGMAWRGGLGVNEAARTGARVGSAQGPLREADFYALSGVKSALTSSGQIDDVTRVVVFRSTSATGTIPTACKTSSTTDCQVISGADFRTAWESQAVTTATTTTGCLQIATAKNWCPTTRINTQAVAEYYGVWVQVQHDYQFPMMGSGISIARTAVMRLEPA